MERVDKDPIIDPRWGLARETSVASVARAVCISGAVTLFLGGVCLADALVAPGLFGSVAAAVVATERLLCAARASSARVAALWTVVALGWIAVAAGTLHTPRVGVQTSLVIVALLVATGALIRWRTSAPISETPTAATWMVAIGGAIQLGILFGAAGAPMIRVASAAAIELALIGLVRLLDAACLRRMVHGPAASLPRSPTTLGAGTINFQTRPA